jgi:hypothetical protein
MAKTNSTPAPLGTVANQTATNPQGPIQDATTGKYAERTPAPGALTIENYGGEGAKGDWAVLDKNGVRLNGPISTPQSLAYWLKQRPGYAARVENLNDLGTVQPHPSIYSNRGRGYRIADVALGTYKPL